LQALKDAGLGRASFAPAFELGAQVVAQPGGRGFQRLTLLQGLEILQPGQVAANCVVGDWRVVG